MPKYQYHCNDCDADLEVQQKFTDDALTECPKCKGNLRKVFSAVGVVFKGSGFYKTDSKQPAAKPADSKPAESKPAESKPAPASSDS
ncbi:FmdB family zinc ribbon protein [uncultured Tessaracoccus sp.]|uniref:FmdB family zinc ribbon protein n=1 Tax=uncultured Tessaracoccus sp. TaxID=905023 RepID=UPI00262A2670|nr:FmdB family zinc ribbon protein [uncultured Tessaracoccus sp.]